MINRKEALENLGKAISPVSEYDHSSIVANVSESMNLINEIYDSIGSCNDCKYGIKSWVAADGQDIRCSQFPSMIECISIKDKTLKFPDWYCANFERK